MTIAVVESNVLERMREECMQRLEDTVWKEIIASLEKQVSKQSLDDNSEGH